MTDPHPAGTVEDDRVGAPRASLLATLAGAGPTRGALLRYRIMAYIVGVGLVVLVFVGIPLQIAGSNAVVAIVGPIHGFLYIVYLLAALDLVRRARLSFWALLGMVAAGLVPFVAFIVEHLVTANVAPRLKQ